MPDNMHIKKRETMAGRWLPAVFYSLIFVSWMATGIAIKAWDLLWLSVFPVPALVIYILRMRK